ncbi:2'-5' RNA ligase family protein [Abyssisolibacter fermentans]|uniref:2'-5' RNA ligase family protein n=1 Tax=Abyssisolibacter fermentans TaxID=1766203 RepID=UPI00082CF055|nr:2'-5' RNA ligase family protein [Abyssisolibacter fermentans]
MYGVLAYFDSETEKYFKNLWQQLVDNNISYYSEEVKDRRPHITIADYNKLDEKKFIKDMDKFYNSKPKIQVTLSVLGTFLNSGTLFIAPTLSKELLNFHNRYHEYFEQYNDEPSSFYLPDKWIPHCTIANRLSQKKLLDAFNYCSQNIGIIKAQISELTLIKIKNEINNSHEVSIVFSKIFL